MTSSSSSSSNTSLSSDSSENNDRHQKILQDALDACDAIGRSRSRCNNASNSRTKKKRLYIERDRETFANHLYKDYFAPQPTYHDGFFRRRFRMRRHVFLHIVETLSARMEYFQQRPDATGRQGFTALQKCTCAIRILAYGNASDAQDEYLRVGESTARECLLYFVQGIITFFGDEYLRRPNAQDIQRLLSVGESRGFPGMLGSIDCMHWGWKNCPTAWRGQYAHGDHGHPTIILEAVVSYDLWFWHAFFGVPGTANDINVLDRSPIFDEVLRGKAPKVDFMVNGNQYKMGYYLADGIYPPWATFVQSIRLPQGDEAKLCAERQEAVRKDAERGFGVLKARFAIVKHPGLSWSIEHLGMIIKACIILHNMIVEDERDSYSHHGYEIPQYTAADGSIAVEEPDDTYFVGRPGIMNNPMLARRAEIRDNTMHRRLKEDLKQHIWNSYGNN